MRLPLGRHEHVGRLEISMHDQLAVRVRHSAGHLQNECNTRTNIELLLPAVKIDVPSFDVFERQPGNTSRTDSCVVETRDAGMREFREYVALALQSLRQSLVRPGGPQELQCQDRKSTRLNSSHLGISYAVFCLKKKKKNRLDEIATQPKPIPLMSTPPGHDDQQA